VKTDYLQSTFLEDKIEVVSHVTSLGEKSLEMTQQVYKNGQREPVAIGKTVMVCFDMKKRVSEIIPQEWREKFIDYEPDLNINQSVRKV
jgi:acyl-CoA thioester hydrolase